MKAAGALILAFAILAVMVGGAAGAQPGVDCRKAKSWADQTVCSDDRLLDLDARLAELLGAAGRALTGPPSKEFRDRQKAWLRTRDDCRNRRNPTTCLEEHYEQRIREVERISGPLPSAPPMPRPRHNRPLDECMRDLETRVEVGPCLEQRLDRARAELERANAAAEAAARDLDAATGRSRAWDGLRQAGADWERYRDAECTWRREMVAGGSGEGDIYLACLVELTEDRVAQLRSR